MMYYQEHRLDFYSTSDTSQPIYTTYQSDTVLETLEEAPPSVKTHYIEVPASDGVIDLTDAVAGRPLYGQRTVDAVVHFVGADHSAAVVWAQQLRDSIHGQRLQVSTPDSRVFDGYYIGRVTVEHEIDQEHVKATIHADCDPWVYYGTVSVELQAGANTVIANGNPIPESLRGSYVNSSVMLRRFGNFMTYDKASREVAIVESYSDNIVQMPEHMIFARFNIDAAATGAQWTYEPVPTANNRLEFTTTIDHTTRVFAAARKNQSTYAIDDLVTVELRSDDSRYFGVHISGTITGRDEEQGTPSIRVMHVVGKLADTGRGWAYKVKESNGGLPNDPTGSSMEIKYTDVPIDESGNFDAFVCMRAEDASTISHPAWIYTGVEVSYCAAEIVCEMYHGWVDSVEYIAPSNNVRKISLPSGMYAAQAVAARDYVTLSPSNSLLYTHYAESGTTATYLDDFVVYQLARTAPTGTPKWVSGYVTDYYGGMMISQVTFARQREITIDAGEMPTTMSIETSSPLTIVIDGRTYNITASGFAPFAFSGEKTLLYSVSGSESAYINYEKGKI